MTDVNIALSIAADSFLTILLFAGFGAVAAVGLTLILLVIATKD